MKISCPNCQKKYALDRAKLPSHVKRARCRACGHLIPLSEAPANGPIEPNLIRFACAGCGKKYKASPKDIPPNIVAVKCRACGQKIQIPRKAAIETAPKPVRPPVPEKGSMPTNADRKLEESPAAVSRPRLKKWFFAAAASILGAVILGVLVNRNVIKIDRLHALIPGAAEKSTDSAQLLDGSMTLSPTAGEVKTRYASDPYIVTTVDTDQLKSMIPRLIQDSIFPGNYWNMGDKPQMTLDLDTINMPNAAFAELTYNVTSIQSPDGKELLRVETGNYKPRIQPGSLFPGNISLSIKKGTPPDHLGQASIDFQLSVPVALEVFDFTVGDQPDSTQEADGIRTTLNRLEKDMARVSSTGGKSLWLIAYDQTGKALASKESMRTATSISTRFEGIISTLRVVVTRRMLNFPFVIDVDLNEGKELVLSREPEIPARMRFNPHPSPTYVNFKTEDLVNLTVDWAERRDGSWNDSLSIQLAQGPFSGYAVWEVHFFGGDKPQFFAASSAQGYSNFSYTLEKGTLKQVQAAFGRVQLFLHTNISRLVFANKRDGQPVPQGLPSGDNVSIKFNQNEITYSAGNADVIQTVAYDSRGRRLKQDQYTRNVGGSRVIYFWGVPAKFEIDVSTKTIEKIIPFNIKRGPVDETAYQAFMQTIENQRDVVNTIKLIDRARRNDRSYYGDDLAGLYYLHHSTQKTPLKLIRQEIAHSDPAGQKRFNYTAKPYKGYYFTVLSGVETSGVKTTYNRRSKKSRFSWQKGTITTTSLTRHPDLVAIPADDSQPTFFLQWGQVFMKPLHGERLEYLPDGYYNKGWVEAKYIDR